MNTISYLEALPLSSIAKYAKERGRNSENDGIPFTGIPRVHPSEKSKMILVYDPLGDEPVVLEFKLEDILFVEEVPSAVTEEGEGIPMVKIHVRLGAIGMIIEPFEVNAHDSVYGNKLAGKVRTVKERFLRNRPQTKT
ncbi:MAG: hypothetical protein LBU66_00085 [Treponema sp.]|jgi:hypothetical protein|nr:hypothetical protein [Treponema sp.]